MKCKSNIKSIGKLLTILSRHISVYLDKKLTPFGINSANLQILIALYNSNHELYKQNDLRDEIMIHKGNISRSIEKLEDAGLLIKQKDKNDNRCFNLKLTKKAISIKEEIQKILKETTDILTGNINNSDKNKIINELNLMLNNIGNKLHEMEK